MFRARHMLVKSNFSAAPQKLGLVWAWIAIHPSGTAGRIWGFHSPQEAREWRAGTGLRAWYRTRAILIERKQLNVSTANAVRRTWI